MGSRTWPAPSSSPPTTAPTAPSCGSRNGTAAGTTQVRNINPGAGSSLPDRLTNVGGTLFFRANDGTNGIELWRSDGSAAGTRLVQNINAGSLSSLPDELTNFAGSLFFRATDGTNGKELWKAIP